MKKLIITIPENLQLDIQRILYMVIKPAKMITERIFLKEFNTWADICLN